MAAIVAVSTTTASDSSAMTADYLRIAGLSIAGYEYLITIPSEVRLYRTTSRRSFGFILFVLIRYLSLALFVFSGVGHFYKHFSPETCAHYAYIGPVFKTLQVMTSHTILGVRTYIIAWRRVWVGRTLIVAYLVAAVFEWFTVFYQRHAVQMKGNCAIGGLPHPGHVLSAWTFYLVVMIFDALALSIATYYLLKEKKAAGSAASKLLKMLLYDGLGYFVVLTAINLVNVLLFREADHALQTSGVNIAYALTLAMCQRLLIHVREARHTQTGVTASPPPSFRPTAALRPQPDKEQIQAIKINDTPTSRSTPSDDSHLNPPGLLSEFDIEVHIETTVLRDARPTYGDSEAIGPDGYAHPSAQGYHV